MRELLPGRLAGTAEGFERKEFHRLGQIYREIKMLVRVRQIADKSNQSSPAVSIYR